MGAQSRGKDSTNEDDTTNDLKNMIAELSQEGLLKFKSLLEKQLKQTVRSNKNVSSSSKSVGRSSQKSVNTPKNNGDDEEHEIVSDEDVNEELEEEEESSEDEDEYVTFRRLSKKKKVTMVRGGGIHMDEYGQAWKTALGHAVKFHCRDIDLGWKGISADAKKKIVKHMESKFGTGVMPRDIIYWAGRSYNHWKNYLNRSKTQTAPQYIEPDVWDRFRENCKADHTQQKKAAAARKAEDLQRWGRRGFDGMLADYFRDWGSYPSAATIEKIKAKQTYKLYRESMIAEGRIPGNFRSLDHVGKKGEQKNKQLKRQRKEQKKNTKLPEDPPEIPGDDLGNDREVNFEEEQNVNQDVHDEGEMDAGGFQNIAVGDDMDWEGDEREVEDQQLSGADGTPPWAAEMEEGTRAVLNRNMLDQVASATLPEKEKELDTLKKKKKIATRKTDIGSISKKNGKKGRGIRNLSPDFGKANVAKNIAQYRSIQRGR